MSSTIESNPLMLTDEDIANYLRQKPSFFSDKPSLLADLTLPHQSGDAISLVERQVSILRDRNIEMRNRLSALIDNARDNDQLFEKTKRLLLSMLEAEDINDLIDALLHSFSNDFNIHYTTVVLFEEQLHEQHLANTSHVNIVPFSIAQQVFGTIISNNQTVCGQLDTGEQQFIFEDNAAHIGSTAITPIASASPLGIIAIGNKDPDYYRSSMNTLFLSYIGEVFSRLLPKHL